MFEGHVDTSPSVIDRLQIGGAALRRVVDCVQSGEVARPAPDAAAGRAADADPSPLGALPEHRVPDPGTTFQRPEAIQASSDDGKSDTGDFQPRRTDWFSDTDLGGRTDPATSNVSGIRGIGGAPPPPPEPPFKWLPTPGEPEEPGDGDGANDNSGQQQPDTPPPAAAEPAPAPIAEVPHTPEPARADQQYSADEPPEATEVDDPLTDRITIVHGAAHIVRGEVHVEPVSPVPPITADETTDSLRIASGDDDTQDRAALPPRPTGRAAVVPPAATEPPTLEFYIPPEQADPVAHTEPPAESIPPDSPPRRVEVRRPDAVHLQEFKTDDITGSLAEVTEQLLRRIIDGLRRL